MQGSQHVGRQVHHWFEEQALRRPEETAVVCECRASSYRELNERACRIAEWLNGAHGSRVAICAKRSVEMIAAVLGTLKAGAACVPLDPEYPLERLHLILRESQPEAVLRHKDLAEIVPCAGVAALDLDGPVPARLLAHPTQITGGEQEPVAYVLFTSGSTGRPKGVEMPHGPLVNLLEWQRRTLPLPPGSKVLQFAPLSFDVSFQEIFSTLSEGGTLVLIRDELRRDPEGLLSVLVEQRIQRLYLPFVALHQLAEAAVFKGRFPGDLREVITAGEQLQITPAIRSFFGRLPSARLHNHYGPTETHVASAYTLAGSAREWPELPPIGRPIGNTRFHLMDGGMHPVKPGETGEIYIAGACVARGYLNQPESTAERFVADPTVSGQRMYRTGDLGRLRDDGEFEFLGRADDQVKIRGYRVELGEVEAALRRHPSVRNCAVAAHKRASEQVLAAYWVARDGTAVSGAVLRDFLLDSLPEPMVPALWTPVETLPLTPSGKVDRRALLPPGEPAAVSIPPSSAPDEGLERVIAEIWESVLGSKGVSATESFFSSGGTSLMTAEVHRRMRSALRQEFPITLLFQYPTIRQLAAQLTKNTSAPASPAVAERAARQRSALARQQAATRVPRT